MPAEPIDPIEAFLKTRPDLEPDDIRLPPSARRPVVNQVTNYTHRLAILTDIPELSILAYKIFRTYPDQELLCRGASKEDFIRYMSDRLSRALAEESKRFYVAVDPKNDALVGYIVFSRVETMPGDMRGQDQLPKIRFPDKTDHDAFRTKARYSEAWTREVLREHGPHIRGDILGVDVNVRRNFIATGLCKILAKEANELDLPVFLETCYVSVPYYERFCDGNGYKLKLLGNRAVDKQCTVISYRFQVIPYIKPEPIEEVPVHFPYSEDPDWYI